MNQTAIVYLLLGIVLLLFGRRLFWFFVGVAGFLVGMNIAELFAVLFVVGIVVQAGMKHRSRAPAG